MTKELFTPPNECPQPEMARAAAETRFQNMIHRAERNRRISSLWPDFERILREKVIDYQIISCRPPKADCSERSICWLAQQTIERGISSLEA